MNKMIYLGPLFTSFLLAGCGATLGPASVEGGDCQVFKDPKFAVQGKRRQDQKWISGTQETGIKVCGWDRPKE